MGLVKCVECGHEISTLATTCPNCGSYTDTYKKALENTKRKNNRILIISAIVLIFIMLIILISIISSIFNKPKADYNSFNSKVTEYLSQIDNITKIRKSTAADDIYYITVNSWIGSDLDKAKYCDAIQKTLTSYAWEYNIIDKNNTICVIFETEEGITLAEPDGIGFGSYKLYY